MYTLLIVDDEPLIRRGILTLVDFKTLNITATYEASHGLEGLALFEQHAPQLILLDINLPMMNGLELAQAIKARNKQAKIAMITGYDYVDYAITALKIGVDDYILKPVSKQDVTDVLAKLIEKYEAERTVQEVQNVLGTLVEAPPDNALKKRIQDAIDQSLSQSALSLTSVAQSLGYAPNYLSSLFKNLFGVTFQDYVLTHRLEMAKLLLLTTSLKNYEISARVGIEDVNYFNTRFKIKYGVSPKQYVTQVRQPNENK